MSSRAIWCVSCDPINFPPLSGRAGLSCRLGKGPASGAGKQNPDDFHVAGTGPEPSYCRSLPDAERPGRRKRLERALAILSPRQPRLPRQREHSDPHIAPMPLARPGYRVPTRRNP
jgi:hypothetical protein